MQAFLTEGAFGAVAGHKVHIITQGQQDLLNGMDQGGVTALRKVTAAHAAIKEHVTYKCQSLLFMHKYDVPGGVTRAKIHVHGFFTDRNFITGA